MSIVLRRTRVGYGARVVLDDLNLTIPPGRVTAFVGPNGCGKSTLLRAIAGSGGFEGEIMVDGAALADYPRRTRVEKLAFVAQTTEADTELSVHRIVSLGRIAGRGPWATTTEDDEDGVRQAMHDADVSHLAARRFNSLSGGERQRVHIARALAQQASSILLDEPTNHLDIHHQYVLMELFERLAHERGICVLMALHDLGDC